MIFSGVFLNLQVSLESRSAKDRIPGDHSRSSGSSVSTNTVVGGRQREVVAVTFKTMNQKFLVKKISRMDVIIPTVQEELGEEIRDDASDSLTEVEFENGA